MPRTSAPVISLSLRRWGTGAGLAPPLARRRRRLRVAAARLAAVPELVELFVVAASAGLPVAVALEAVAGRSPQPLRADVRAASGRFDQGVPLLECLADLGRSLGPAGVVWLEQRAARFARFVRWIESWFRKAPRMVVLFFAGPTVSALAGMGGMSLGTYASLAGLSLFVRLLVIYAFGEALREPIEWLLAVIDAYWVQITVAMVLGVLVYQRWRSRRSRGDGDQPLQST